MSYNNSGCKGRTSITAQLVPPGTALVNTYSINLLHRLCAQICATGSDVVAAISFGTPVVELVDATTGIYNITIPVLGTLTYVPANAGPCCTKVDTISGSIVVPVTSTDGIASVKLTPGQVVGTPIATGCGCCTTNLYEVQTVLTVTATATTTTTAG